MDWRPLPCLQPVLATSVALRSREGRCSERLAEWCPLEGLIPVLAIPFLTPNGSEDRLLIRAWAAKEGSTLAYHSHNPVLPDAQSSSSPRAV